MDSLLSCLVCLNVNVAVFDLELKNVSKFDAVNRRFHAFDVFWPEFVFVVFANVSLCHVVEIRNLKSLHYFYCAFLLSLSSQGYSMKSKYNFMSMLPQPWGNIDSLTTLRYCAAHNISSVSYIKMHAHNKRKGFCSTLKAKQVNCIYPHSLYNWF